MGWAALPAAFSLIVYNALMKYFLCTPSDFLPAAAPAPVRWLDPLHQYDLACAYWQQFQIDLPLETWLKAHDYGYQYAAHFEDGQILSLAALWRFSERVWEVAAFSTLAARQPYTWTKAVASFVTSHTLQSGRWATFSANDDNNVMIATAQSLGFREIGPEQILWTYPQLPDL
jgi:hypothetical protein